MPRPESTSRGRPPRRAKSSRWGGANPGTDEERRELLLDAASACLASGAGSRLSIDDVAEAAAVHRTTVYKYFADKDELIAAAVFRQGAAVIAQAEKVLASPGTFVSRLTAAFSVVHDGLVGSPVHRRLISLQSPEFIASNVEASDAFQEMTARALGPTVAEAASNGELRAGLSEQEVIDWLGRAMVLLLIEAVADPRRDAPQAFARFVLPGVAARGD